MTFSLRALVREVIESGVIGPEAVAAEVAGRVNNKLLRDALGEALVVYARHEIDLDRRGNVILSGAGQGNSGQSSKVAAIREHAERWRRALADQVNTADGYKVLGECTYDDLMFAAEQRRAVAARTLAKADQFESLALLLKRHGAETVAELPETVLADEMVAA